MRAQHQKQVRHTKRQLTHYTAARMGTAYPSFCPLTTHPFAFAQNAGAASVATDEGLQPGGINLAGISAKYIILYPTSNMPERVSIAPEQLVSLLQSKSREAFSVLYDSYSEAIYGIICRMVTNKAAAEDLLQDVFVKIWRKIDSYDAARGTLFTWMINIARNICIDYLRSKQYKQQMKVVENNFEYTESGVPAFEPNYHITNVELHKVTQKLEVKHRQVIEMVYFRGYTHEEVAQILNIPVGTVKTRSRAGLKQLRSLYN